MTSPATTHRRDRADIQGLRAVAVLSVLLSHASLLGFSGGFVGVDVFFVISGFLITGGLVREVRDRGRVSIADFYARRARRILPAAAVVLLAIAVGSAVCYTAGDLRTVLSEVRWATFFGENIKLATARTDYFAENSFVSPVQHFWSLAVEEQFYLAWPLLLGAVAWLTFGRRARTRSRGRIAVRRAAALVIVLGLLSFAWSLWDTRHNPSSAYFSTFTRAWELAIGALLALLAPELSRIPRPVRIALGWGGLLAILIACFGYDASTPFPGYAAALPVLGSAAILLAGAEPEQFGVGRVLGIAPMRFVGDISYSLYLWHWPLLIMAPAYQGHPISLRGRVVLLVAAVALAWLSYRFVETPFRRARWVTRTRLRSLVLWPGAVAVLLAGALVVQIGFATVPKVEASTGTTTVTGTPAQQAGALQQDVRESAQFATANKKLPEALVPALPDLLADVSQPEPGCSVSTAEGLSHKLCPLGDTSSSKVIALWGDSHAGQWMTTLSDLAKAKGYKLVLFAKATCVPVQALEVYYGKPYPQCLTFQRWVLDQLRAIKPAMVIMSGKVGGDLVDPKTGQVQSEPAADKQFRTQAEKTLREVRSITPRTAVISDINLLPQDASRCLGSRTSTYGTCAQPQHPAVARRNALWKSAATATGATFVDMVPWFCQSGTCPVVVGNMIVYRDSNHVTASYVDKLRPVLESQLDF
ncbi:acyltransferase [Flexivirga sp. ID2601S]|uniref:Acyltransferase n=1 Tax=Flexivirga aerilata TaxID=1656889 RepID=A0A849AIB7_9MICO|nr:acyltransferase family protein [Flexivirga aerilata]NNG39061.1 acyltransferase [Flexivirga aerilata]